MNEIEDIYSYTSIRNVKKDDLRAVSEIVVNGWKTAYLGIIDKEFLDNMSIEDTYQRRLKDYTENGFIVAELNNEVVGFCRYRTGNDYKEMIPNVDCEICALYVKPELKRKGIGKKLVNYVINEFKNDGYKKMIIWCLNDNYPSRAFYEKMGGRYCDEKTFEKGNREYKEAGFLYDLRKLPKDDLKLIKPNEEYKEQVMNYRKVFLDNNESLDGCAGLEDCQTFEEWIDFENRLKNKYGEGYVPSDTYLAIRVKDNKLVGMIDIRKKMTDFFYNYGGVIGYSVIPEERRKGYATEILKQGLEKCKEIGINRVLISCDRENIGSAKTIIANEGVLENEVHDDIGLTESGTIQRYWISLKRRYADRTAGNRANAEQKIISVQDDSFKGDIYFYNFFDVKDKILIPNGKCIIDNNYKWLEFYDYSSKTKLTAIYDEKNEIIEWYFDIAREIGINKGIPYEDDLYLDVVVTPNGNTILLDEDELKIAYENREITKEEYDNAYNEAVQLKNKFENNEKELKLLTDKYLNLFVK